MYPIPANATRIRYLESTGTQYVDTGVVPDSNTSFETRYIQTSAPYQFCPVAYAGDAYNSSNTFGFAVNNAIGINSYFGTAVNLHVGDYMIAIGQTILIKFRRGNANIVMTNETTGTTSSSSFGSATYTKGSRTLYLMNGNTGTTDLAHPGCLRMFSFLLYDGSTLVRDYVPVRVGQTGYLFDRVSGQLFGNAGTGDFVLGPDTFSQGVVPTRMMAMGVRKKESLGSVSFSGSQWSNLYHEFSGSPPSAYTWSGWVKTDATPTHGCFVKVGKIQEPGNQGSGFAFGFGSTRFESSYSGSNIVALAESVAWKNGNSVSNLTSWNHFSVVVNSGAFTVYKNGASIYSSSASPRNDSPHGVYMGGYSGTTQTVERFLACKMTRCAMWNRALSTSEVAADYADGKKAPSVTSGLQHYWPMSNAKNYLKDEVGSATLTAGVGGVTISTDTPFA